MYRQTWFIYIHFIIEPVPRLSQKKTNVSTQPTTQILTLAAKPRPGWENEVSRNKKCMAARARLNFFFARSKFLPRGAMNPNSKQIFQNFASNKPKLFCLPRVFSLKSAVKQRLPSFMVAEKGASV